MRKRKGNVPGAWTRLACEAVMPLFIFEWVVEWLLAGAATLYVSYCGVQAHRRSTQPWELLVARLQSAEAAKIDAAGPVTAKRRGLRAAYRVAGVALEMADYAERNGDAQAGLLETLRNAAAQIRLLAVRRLVIGVLAR